jgi:hypothetical protein
LHSTNSLSVAAYHDVAKIARRAARGTVHGVELAGQFPIGGPDRWRRIVDNLAVLVAELDRGFVPEIEAASGRSPEWYRPNNA